MQLQSADRWPSPTGLVAELGTFMQLGPVAFLRTDTEVTKCHFCLISDIEAAAKAHQVQGQGTRTPPLKAETVKEFGTYLKTRLGLCPWNPPACYSDGSEPCPNSVSKMCPPVPPACRH